MTDTNKAPAPDRAGPKAHFSIPTVVVLALMGIGIATVSTAVLVVASVWRTQEAVSETSAHAELAIVDLLKHELAPALDFGDKDEAIRVLDRLLSHPDTRYIAVLDADGALFARRSTGISPGRVEQLDKGSFRDQELVRGMRMLVADIGRETNDSEHAVGRLIIGLSRATEAHLQQKNWRDGLLFGALVLLCVAILAMLLARFTARPIGRLTLAIQRVSGEGDLGVRVRESRLREIGELTRAFNTMMAKLQAAMVSKEAAETANKAKSAFLATISHELRTPLNAILGYAQLMQRDQALTDDLRKNVVTINRSGDHLLQLINDVLEMSKIEAGSAVVSTEAFDLHALLQEVLSIFQVRARVKKISLDLHISASLPRYVSSDQGKIRQLLINLLGNALKFTKYGGIVVHAEAAEANSKGVQMALTVEDSGVGIETAALDRIFKPFEQATAGQQSMGGTGLGLAISREFCRLLGGELHVESEVGKGSIFRAELHATLARQSQLAHEDSSQHIVGIALGAEPPRVLVVDDNQVNRELIIDTLKPLGFVLKEACDGVEAVAASESWRPDLILMDLAMPEMDGYEATRRIKATEHGARTPVIAVTASSLESDRKKSDEAGLDGYLRKPFRRAQLMDEIVKHLMARVRVEQPEPDGLQPEPIDVSSLDASSLAPLPPALRVELAAAGIAADTERLNDLLRQVAAIDVVLSAALATLVEDFEYDKLLDLLNSPDLQKDEAS